MQPKISCLIAVASAVFIGARSELPELRPELGRYQNGYSCFPLNPPWYTVYRSFELDPYLGGNAKCIRVVQTTPLVNNTAEGIISFGANGKLDVKMTLGSSPGYKFQNVVRVSPKGLPDLSLEFRDAYANCGKCKILRHPYISDTACSVLAPEKEVNKLTPECHFIYELLCGTKKYPIYESSCKSTD